VARCPHSISRGKKTQVVSLVGARTAMVDECEESLHTDFLNFFGLRRKETNDVIPVVKSYIVMTLKFLPRGSLL
jgi:hypothetical protein